MRTKDPQREAVYEWEGEFADWNRQTLTLPAVRAYVRTACAKFGLPAPAVRSHKGKAMAYCMDDGSHMSFPDWCKNPAVALHEAAHYIADMLLGKRIQPHGPSWLGVYMWLLEEANVAPGEALRRSARKRGLRWVLTNPQQVARKARARLSDAA